MSPVGILGGSFNPPHAGHLICARMAAEQLELEGVLIVPLCRAPHRTLERDPGAPERLELCRAAVAGDPVLQVCADEVERGGTSFTVQTLEELRDREGVTDPVLILGADAARNLDTWKDPDRVLELAGLAIAPRGAGPQAAQVAAEVERRYPGARAAPFAMPQVEISSSMIRERIAAGLSIRDMVPAPVDELIAERGWYREGNR